MRVILTVLALLLMSLSALAETAAPAPKDGQVTVPLPFYTRHQKMLPLLYSATAPSLAWHFS